MHLSGAVVPKHLSLEPKSFTLPAAQASETRMVIGQLSSPQVADH